MTILDRILETKRAEVAQAKRERPMEQVIETARIAAPPRDFLLAIAAPPATGTLSPDTRCGTGFQPMEPDSSDAAPSRTIRQGFPRLIAEIKQKSPSAGVIRSDFDPVAIARVYHQHGAAALSVLTDETYFGGRLEFIKLVKEAVPLPVLRKEFIVEAYQVYESRAAGADAMLLIAEAIGAEQIAQLAPLAHELGMTCLVEVHSQENLAAVLNALGPPVRLPEELQSEASVSAGTVRTASHQAPQDAASSTPYILGINNRDLSIQRTDLETTVRLAAHLPSGCAFVSESGISTRADVETVRAAGACAILVGESLLRAPDMGRMIHQLIDTPPN